MLANRPLVTRLLISCLIGVLASCAPKPPPSPPSPPPPPPAPEPPKPTAIQASIQVSAQVNPDPNGRPSPIVLRLYELKSLSNFNGADFFLLYDQEAHVLGPEMVSREVMELNPGMQRSFERQLQPETRFIGVIAAFRAIEQARWRAAEAIPEHRTTPLIINVDRLTVSIHKVVEDKPGPKQP
jgi:type VI secretion system protein VasD